MKLPTRRRLILLSMLVVAAGVWGYMTYVRKPPALAPNAPPTPKAPIYSTERILSDGSFNPNPRIKPDPARSPAELKENKGWRERYRPLLQTAGAESPAFYVYPFLDQTRHGIGIHCTYGSHLVCSAALAHQTTARLCGADPPRRYGLPDVDETKGSQVPTPSEWLARAMNDPVAKDARYLIIGVFSNVEGSETIELRVNLFDRESKSTDGGTALFEARMDQLPPASTSEGIEIPAAVQRKCALAIVGKLVELGLAERRKPATHGLSLESELDEIAVLLDSNDSWTVMDGIDRSLQLACLFGDSSLPIQAASYGLNMLSRFLFGYGFSQNSALVYSIRAYALAQICLAMDMNPGLAHLNWLVATLPFDHNPSRRKSVLTGKDHTAREKNLAGYLSELDGIPVPIGPLADVATLPDWQVLSCEGRLREFRGQGTYDSVLKKLAPHWADHDFYLQSWINMKSHYQYMHEVHFASKQEAATVATRATIAAEVAALLMALADVPDVSRFMQDMQEQTGLNREDLVPLVAQKDYYGLRGAALKAFKRWPLPADPSHPALELLPLLTSYGTKVSGNPALAKAESGFLGFEFTPLERFRFAQRRDMLGPLILADFYTEEFGSPEMLVALAAQWLKARPDNMAAQSRFSRYLNNYLLEPGAEELYLSARKEGYENYPLDAVSYYYLGRYKFFLSQPEIGKLYLGVYNRLDPFSNERFFELGELCERYKYLASGEEYFRSINHYYPMRFDFANRRAWMLCEMGRWNDPEVRKIFERAVQGIRVRVDFNQDYITYLRAWAKDLDAARKASKDFVKSNPAWGPIELARVEADAGDRDKAVAALGQFSDAGLQGLRLAIVHASLARAYIQYDQLDQAKEHVQKAIGIDSWQGTVIFAMAEYAFAEKRYDEAIGQYERYLQRYGANAEATLGLARCMRKKSMPQQAVKILEEHVRVESPHLVVCHLIPELISLYVELDQKSDAQETMRIMLASSLRTRRGIEQALEEYKKILPKEAEEIGGRLNEIMAGPPLLE